LARVSFFCFGRGCGGLSRLFFLFFESACARLVFVVVVIFVVNPISLDRTSAARMRARARSSLILSSSSAGARVSLAPPPPQRRPSVLLIIIILQLPLPPSPFAIYATRSTGAIGCLWLWLLGDPSFKAG
jgi:hypothetical protein